MSEFPSSVCGSQATRRPTCNSEAHCLLPAAHTALCRVHERTVRTVRTACTVRSPAQKLHTSVQNS